MGQNPDLPADGGADRPFIVPDPHARDTTSVMELLDVSSAGLGAQEAARRKAQYGPNALPGGKQESALPS